VLRQCIELPPLLGRQLAGQPPFDFPTSLKAELDAEAFKARERWGDNAAPPAFRHDQFRQIEETVSFDRLRLDGACKFSGGAPAERTQAQPLLSFDSVSLSNASLTYPIAFEFRIRTPSDAAMPALS